MKARGEILKRVQDDMMDGVRMTFRDAVSHLLVSEGLLALAISRLEDGKLNSRGFSNPWKVETPHNQGRLEDGGFQYRWTFKSSDTLPFRVFTDAFLFFPLFPRT